MPISEYMIARYVRTKYLFFPSVVDSCCRPMPVAPEQPPTQYTEHTILIGMIGGQVGI